MRMFFTWYLGCVAQRFIKLLKKSLEFFSTFLVPFVAYPTIKNFLLINAYFTLSTLADLWASYGPFLVPLFRPFEPLYILIFSFICPNLY